MSLKERLTDPCAPITTVQDIEFPPKENRKYNNYLVAVICHNGCWCYKFVMKDGSSSKEKECGKEEIRLQPADTPVKRILIWFQNNTNYLMGI
jgi:hypothetical protein